MKTNVSNSRNPHRFSLGGFSMVASFMMPVALSDSFINQAIDARLRQAGERGKYASASASGSEHRAPKWDSAHCLVHEVELPCDCRAA